ncbi:hypothetical protein [Tropicimonas marinistellae]|uniref:hypothetical protein n=1 Tax=Tropicimonas marinistellae TaxID=1739787 RepID=UPI00082C92F8|nr:hypothetical protein [Tropicimonas marinistellae]
MKRHSMGRAPDYTTAALVSAGINLFCLLLALRLILGWGAVLLTAAGLNHLIARLAARRGA